MKQAELQSSTPSESRTHGGFGGVEAAVNFSVLPFR